MDSKWKKIKLLVSDFDGVMTDNRVLIDEEGKEYVYVSRADGQAIHMLKSIGVEVVIISSEINCVVRRRAEKLKIDCIHGVADKAECLKMFCDEKDISLRDIAYIGNDINDFEAMLIAGIKIVPQDAHDVVKNIADYVTNVKGGYGVIREVAELLQKNR